VPPPSDVYFVREEYAEVDLHLSETSVIVAGIAFVITLALQRGWGVRTSVDKKQWKFETKEPKRRPCDDANG
jgi:hypothetical protein